MQTMWKGCVGCRINLSRELNSTIDDKVLSCYKPFTVIVNQVQQHPDSDLQHIAIRQHSTTNICSKPDYSGGLDNTPPSSD